jgi:hypothetical protein
MENGSSEPVTTIVEGQGLSIGRALGTENITIAYKRSERHLKKDCDLFEEVKEHEITCVLGLYGHDQSWAYCAE